jgi:3-oxoacyl-[acyl-carrier-protein] synthase-3
MSHQAVRIAGSGSYLPDRRLDNFELYDLPSIQAAFDVERARGSLKDMPDAGELPPPEVFDRWAVQVTGISERRVLPKDRSVTTEDMCAQASLRALEAAGMAASDLDLIYVACLTGSDSVPNPACTVAELIGAPALGGYTLNAACAGFIHALGTGYAVIRSGMGRNVLVVAGDALSHITDYGDPTTAVLFGDGAGATVLTPSEAGDGVVAAPVILGNYQRDPLFLLGQGWETEEDPDPKLRMGGGPRILRRAIGSMIRVAEEALERAGKGWDDVDVVVPHQANLRITKGMEKQLDEHDLRVVHNIQRYGNMSASTVPVAFDEVLRGKHGPLPDPATIVLTSIGGGYAISAAVVEWRGGVVG